MVITSVPSHGNDAIPPSDPAPPVEDEPPICGSTEKSKDESVTTIEERTGDDITEYAHTVDVKHLADRLQVNLKNGLGGDEAAARLAANGPNRLKDGKKVSVFEILLRQVSNSLTFVLAIVMILSFSLGDWIEGAVVAAVVLVNIVVGFVQDFKAEQSVLSLQVLSSPECNVIRGSIIQTVRAESLVVGDIVQLSTGDIVPGSWPPLLSVLYWLTLLARVSDNLDASSSPSAATANDLMLYITHSYSLFISGDDEAVASLDEEYVSKARAHAEAAAEAVQALEKEAEDLEAKRTKLTSGPSRREALEAEKEAFTADVQKFEAVVKSWATKIKEKEESLVDLEKELEAKVVDGRRMVAENEELVKKVEAQVVNVRDADRMQREMQAVEHDIAKVENGKAVLEEKGWELESAVVRKLEEIEALAEQCNQALRKLKPGINFQYMLNAKGSAPAEILGTSYKTVLKPALNTLADETKRISVSKLDDSIDLEKQLQGNVKILEDKRSHISVLQAKTDEMVARLNSLDLEIGNHVSRCTADARQTKDELERKEHHLTTVEKEADEFLKNSEHRLQDALQETDEETQMCASELLQLIDSITEYKEFMETSISGMKKDLYECADDIASLSAKMISTSQTSAHP